MMELKKDYYQAIIVDFDGTLVDTDFQISPQVKEAILRLTKKGYVFSIATGRCYSGIISRVCRDLELKSPQIISGGAEIINPQIDKLIWYEYIIPENAKKIIKYFLDNKYQFAVESKGYVFTAVGIPIKAYGPNITFKKLEQLDYNFIAKIVLDDRRITDWASEEDKLTSAYADLHIIRSGMTGSPVLDITSAKATKHLAVLQLSKILHIPTQLMIGVGDGYNDYPLLSVCGFKVAMANAPGQLKDIANLVLPDVIHNGLVDLLNRL